MSDQLSIVTITVSSREAEEILIGLAHRAKQKGVTGQHLAEIQDIGKRLSSTFAAHYGWAPGWWDHAMKNEIRVTVTPRNRW